MQSRNIDELVLPIKKTTVNKKRPNENSQSSDKQIKKRKLSLCENPITKKDNSKLKMELNNKSTKPSDKTQEENTTKKLVNKPVKRQIGQIKEMKEKPTIEKRVVNDKGNQNITKTAEIKSNNGIGISANHPILNELIKAQETTTSSLKENNHKTYNEKTTENIGETSQEIDKTVVENIGKDYKSTSSAPTGGPSILKQASEEELAEEAERERVGSTKFL